MTALHTRTPLPELIDCAGLMAELGISRSAAETLMRKVEKIKIEGLRKVYVRRLDINEYLESQTRS